MTYSTSAYAKLCRNRKSLTISRRSLRQRRTLGILDIFKEKGRTKKFIFVLVTVAIITRFYFHEARSTEHKSQGTVRHHVIKKVGKVLLMTVV